MDRTIFFAHIRGDPFSGRMTASQVSGIEELLESWNFDLDDRWLAYTLATDFHESGARMQPVREGFKKTDAAARAYVRRLAADRGTDSAVARYAQPVDETGHVYYGRGRVQLTWAYNYKRIGEAMGLGDALYRDPDRTLDPEMSIRILIMGMIGGLFSGKALKDYFSAGRDDPLGARRIVNGTDKARLIVGYHKAFLAAIQAARSQIPPAPEPAERETQAPRYPEEPKPLSKSRTMAGSAVATTGTAGTAVVTEIQADAAGDPIGDTLGQAQDAASMLADVLEVAKWILIALVIAGIAWTIYARWDDHRKGLR